MKITSTYGCHLKSDQQLPFFKRLRQSNLSQLEGLSNTMEDNTSGSTVTATLALG
jgi:hypothetical protein